MKKYALVTGASRGIGRAVAVKLAEMGYAILINYASNTAAAEQTLARVQEVGSEGELMPFDVTDAAAVESALTAWKERHAGEHIAVIVNNAGIRKDNLMMWMPRTEWHQVLDTTLDGFFHVMQPLLKDMIVAKWGRIVNIVSLSGIKGMPGQTNYSAAKGGLIAATKALASEVAKKRITLFADMDVADFDIDDSFHPGEKGERIMGYEARMREKADALRKKGAAVILAVESSCDETAIAVVENGRIERANAIASQIDVHALYGGVVPEADSRPL